jgi:hemoglobin
MRALISGPVIGLMLLASPAFAADQPMDHQMPAAASANPATAGKSLFERLGGQPAIDAVVDDFAPRVLADARINKKFTKTDAPRLVAMLKSFMCSATGGPCQYTGLSMKASHKNMGVTDAEFGALVEDLVASLDKFNVPAQEKGELLAALGPLGPDIIEVHTDATGTALPATFKPAPPLKGTAKKHM